MAQGLLLQFEKDYKIFAVPYNMLFFDILKEIRQMVSRDETATMYLVAGSTVINPTSSVGESYMRLKEQDGFLYLSVKESNFF